MRSPVLLLLHNDPAATRATLAAVRAARPARLYVAADGPDARRHGDADACAEARRIATTVDWPCDVRTLLRDEPLGAGHAIEWAIAWFFGQETEGVILESGWVPEPAFFQWCDGELERHRADPAVWHVNAQPGARARGGAWATWRDRWQQNPLNAWYLREAIRPQRWDVDAIDRMIELDALREVCAGRDAWEDQWRICVLDHQGRVVAPDRPLAHVVAGTPRGARGNRWLKAASIQWQALVGRWQHWNRELRRRIFFVHTPPIVVASSGRQGSTLLFDAIVDAALDLRRRAPFRALGPRRLRSLVSSSAWMLDAQPLGPRRVYKTHDLPKPTALAGARTLFVFGDPLPAALSTVTQGRQRGLPWVDEHIWHLRGHGRADELLTRDALNYERQLVEWGAQPPDRVLIVHYEDLWQRIDEISAFVGFRVTLPERKGRAATPAVAGDVDAALYDRLTHRARELRAALERR